MIKIGSFVIYKVRISNFRILDINSELINNNQITFYKDVTVGTQKERITIFLGNPDKENIHQLKISSENDLLEVELLEIADSEAFNLLNMLAFIYKDCEVGEPYVFKGVYGDKKADMDELLGEMFVRTSSEVEGNLLKELVREIESETCFNNEIYSIFRTALNNKDVIVKYMFLYQILYSLNKNEYGNESQKEVDKYIMTKVDKSKHQYQKWKDSHKKKETIYTRLRNQVGHSRKKTSQETRIAMEETVNDLIYIVKECIKERS